MIEISCSKVISQSYALFRFLNLRQEKKMHKKQFIRLSMNFARYLGSSRYGAHQCRPTDVIDRTHASSIVGPEPRDRRTWENGAQALMTSEETTKFTVICD